MAAQPRILNEMFSFQHGVAARGSEWDAWTMAQYSCWVAPCWAVRGWEGFEGFESETAYSSPRQRADGQVPTCLLLLQNTTCSHNAPLDASFAEQRAPHDLVVEFRVSTHGYRVLLRLLRGVDEPAKTWSARRSPYLMNTQDSREYNSQIHIHMHIPIANLILHPLQPRPHPLGRISPNTHQIRQSQPLNPI